MSSAASAEHAAALRAALDERLAARDRAGAVLAAVDSVRVGDLGVLDLERLVLAPLMIDTGAAWQSGEIQVWEEHFASATVRTIVDALYPDVVALAREAVVAVGASGIKDKGKVMQHLMPMVKGKAEGKDVSEIVTGLLSSM